MNELEENIKPKFRDRLRKHFRLVVLNEDDLKEVYNYDLSLLNIYLLISSVLVILGLLIVAFIVFTPIKTLIPGYGEIEANKEFLDLQKKTTELENNIVAMTEYLERSKIRLSGQEGENISEMETQTPSSNIPITFDATEIIRKRDSEKNVSKAKLGQYYLLAPLNGPLSLTFNPSEKHFGIDILGAKNTAVKAIMDGYVISSDWTLETGNTIAIQHANNIVSFYKHNSSNLKKAGSFVQAGEAIAIIGNSGTLSDGPHLHFELWYNGHPVNPTEFINF